MTEPLSKPLFVKRKRRIKKPKSPQEILQEAHSRSLPPSGEANYWGRDKTLWKKG